MRKTVVTLKKGLYLLLTELIAVYLIAFPAYAFQVSSSSTGYVRVATQPAQLAYVAANRAALISTVASAAAVVSPASVAVRLVTGPVGWAALGVSVALTLAQMYYSTADLQAVKTAASPVPSGAATTYTFNGNNYAMPTNQFVGSPVTNPVCTGSGGKMYGWPGGSGAYPGWTPSGIGDWYCGPTVPFTPAQAPTPQQVADYLTGLPANSPNAPESHVTPVGQGAPVTPADNITTNPVTPSQITPTVKPAAQVTPTDTVIDPNAPAPAGAQPPVPAAQTTTTTTTTTTNPDGSTTTQDADTATVSCSAGNHDQRTFGSVLQEHMTRWQGTGLLSALNLLKTLTWPTAIPTYSLQSSLLGTFTLDFSAWSGLLTALRSLIIALAAFVAYRIIFVGHA
jgi:hypothetical protein